MLPSRRALLFSGCLHGAVCVGIGCYGLRSLAAPRPTAVVVFQSRDASPPPAVPAVSRPPVEVEPLREEHPVEWPVEVELLEPRPTPQQAPPVEVRPYEPRIEPTLERVVYRQPEAAGRLEPQPLAQPEPVEPAKPVAEAESAPQAEPVRDDAPDVSVAGERDSAQVKAEPLADNPPPEYPVQARRRGIEGTVHLRVSIDAGGDVLAVEVERSSGSRLLDRAAVRGVRRWRFRPGRVAGEAVASQATVGVSFARRGD